jgi:hypothetical protein
VDSSAFFFQKWTAIHDIAIFNTRLTTPRLHLPEFLIMFPIQGTERLFEHLMFHRDGRENFMPLTLSSSSFNFTSGPNIG